MKVSKNGWLLTSSYATRNVDCIPRIKIKHNFFKNNFFPSAIIEQNKLDPAIRNAESFGIFKSNILKFSRPTPRSFFSCYNHPILHCLLFDDKAVTLLSTLNKTDCKLIETNESSLIETLLPGSSLFDLKKKTYLFLMHPLITFYLLKDSKRPYFNKF